MTLYAVGNPGDTPTWQGETLDEQTPTESGDNAGGLPEYRIERLGDLYHEKLIADPSKLGWGIWVSDAAAKEFAIDEAHKADFGADSIRLEHALKAHEALLIVAGYPIDGIVAAEASATGQDMLELANSICSKACAGELRRAIISRRVAKSEVRKGDNNA